MHSNYLLDNNEETEHLRENLRTLLHSRDEDYVRTALELLQTGGLPRSLADDLMFAYLMSTDLELRARIQTIFLESPQIPDFDKRYFKQVLAEPWVGLSGSEQTIRRRLLKYFSRKELIFNPLQLAKIFYNANKQGYLYILEEGKTADRLAFLQRVYRWGHLHLEGLRDLFRLPEELVQLPDLQGIHLRGCGFRVFPKVLLQPAFQNLKLLDLRNNPIKEIPSRVRKHLPVCELLI